MKKIRYIFIGVMLTLLLATIYYAIYTFVAFNKEYEYDFDNTSYEEKYNEKYNSINVDKLTSNSKKCLNEVEKLHSFVNENKSGKLTIFGIEDSYMDLLNACSFCKEKDESSIDPNDEFIDYYKDSCEDYTEYKDELSHLISLSYILDPTYYSNYYSNMFSFNINLNFDNENEKVRINNVIFSKIRNSYQIMNLVMSNLEYTSDSEVKINE